jgi:hypothetical protein
MAYRIDAAFAREDDFSLSAPSHLFDSSTHFSPFMSATSLTLAGASDVASRAASPFAHTPFGIQQGGIGGPMLFGSPADPDAVPGDNTSTVTLNVMEGQTLDGTINLVGQGTSPPLPGTDADWYMVHLEAGNSYKFDMAQADQGSTGPDFRLTLYDAEGNVASPTVDNGGMGAPEELRYGATVTGTYYISVDNYTAGDLGDYSLSGSLDNTGGSNAGTPLAAIDWGGPTCKMDDGVDDGVTHITVYYAKPGEVWGSADDPIVSVGWDDFAKAATFVAFDQYEHIINVDFAEATDSSQADWILVQTATAPALLGQMRPPGTENEGQGDFNKVGFDYDEPSTHQGGYSFITFIHEFGHGMGLAHPHDTGGGSEVMHGVTGDVATGFTTGDFHLNQGVYTTMSYNDGWPDGPDGTSDSTAYGYQGTLMALDVAELQIKYGANMDYHTGDNTYRMPDVNQPGTMYACIWDAGGDDTISARGTSVSAIDLRTATLQYEDGGGGFISHTSGIFGGFTIANGVVIENAVGARGGDSITGNDAANHLIGKGGTDNILGGDGDDVIAGGRGADMLTGGDGADTFVFEANGANHDTNTDLAHRDIIDLSAIDAIAGTGEDDAFTLVSAFDGNAGELVVSYPVAAGLTRFSLDTDGDGAADIVIFAAGRHVGFDNFIL